MTGLLVGTFVVGGAHTLLWLPRALQMRKELKEAEAAEEREIEEQGRSRAAAGPEPGSGTASGGPGPQDRG
jgi:hypothetical protein